MEFRSSLALLPRLSPSSYTLTCESLIVHPMRTTEEDFYVFEGQYRTFLALFSKSRVKGQGNTSASLF